MRLSDFVPPQYVGHREARRQALMMIYSIVIGITTASICFLALALVTPIERAVVSLVWILPIGLSFYVLRFSETPSTAAHFFTFVVALGVSLTYLLHGGYTLLGFVGVPFAAAFLLSTGAGIFWTLGMTLWCLILGANVALGTDNGSGFVLAVSGMTLLIGGASVVADRMRARALTETERAYAALALERNRTRNVVEALFPGLIDVEGTQITYVAQGIDALAGYQPEELVGQDLWDFVHPDDTSAALHWADQRQPGQSIELRLRHKDGQWVWAKIYLVPIATDEHQLTFAGYDISAERQAREQHMQTQRLDSIGVLASGVAHDFNNLLTVISGFAELMDESDARDNILHASQDAASLVQKLMAFGQGSMGQSNGGADVCQILKSSYQVLDSVLGPGINLHINAPREVATVQLSASQISQVLLNLVTNAKESLGPRGNVWIDVELQENGANNGRGVALSVADDGPGMSAEVLAHAFDPFYTTKSLRAGTGLGLASVYGIARHAGGIAWIDSEPNNGCCVTLQLPLVSAAEATPELEEVGDFEHGQGQILVVDDDELVADLVARTLVHVGYSVTIKNDVESAWTALQSNVPDLLISDIMMPDGRGTELASRLRDSGLAENLPILFISGYADSEIGDWQDVGRAVKFLAKPFRAQELLNRVGQLLRTRGQGNVGDRTGTY